MGAFLGLLGAFLPQKSIRERPRNNFEAKSVIASKHYYLLRIKQVWAGQKASNNDFGPVFWEAKRHGKRSGQKKNYSSKNLDTLTILGSFWPPKWTLEASFLRVVFSCVFWTVFCLILGAKVHPGEGKHSYPFCIFFVPGHPWGPKWPQGCPKDPQGSILLPF